MDNSILIARFLGPYIIMIGFALLFNLERYKNIAEDFFKNSALVYLSGLLTFVAGLAIVLSHNIWEMDWRLIITVFGWIALTKGVLLTVSPDLSLRMSRVFIKNTKLVAIPWTLMFALGIFLLFKGFLPH